MMALTDLMARISVALAVRPEDRVELERLVRSGKTEQRVAFRGRIILLATAGWPNRKIAESLGTSRPTVMDWRKRYARVPQVSRFSRPGSGPLLLAAKSTTLHSVHDIFNVEE